MKATPMRGLPGEGGGPRGECVEPEVGRLLVRYELGELDAEERERFVDHLLACEACGEELYALGPLMAELGRERREAREETPAPGHFPGRPWRAWALAAGLLLSLATAAFLLLQRAPGPSPLEATLRDLPVPVAPYTVPAEGTLRSGEGSPFEAAMEAYREGDFATAAEELALIARLEPERWEARFYQGVSLLLIGHAGKAVEVLQPVARQAVGEGREESLYYLALALLKSGRTEEASTELRRLTAGLEEGRDDTKIRSEARRLLGRLEASGER